jgi:hypothetical protein
MDIHVNVTAGSVDILQREDLTRLEVNLTGGSDDEASGVLGTLGRLEGDYAWLNVESLRRLAGSDRPEWNEGYVRMIEFARSHGWTNADASTVRAHVIRD